MKTHLSHLTIVFLFAALMLPAGAALASEQPDPASCPLSNNPGAVLWNTFLGGGRLDGANSIAVDGSGNSYIAGSSTSAWGSPVRPYSAGIDTSIIKLDPNGNLL
jgi:hypothetical protein